jgi:hypothetical protein
MKTNMAREIEQGAQGKNLQAIAAAYRMAMLSIRKLLKNLKCSWSGFCVLTIGMPKYPMRGLKTCCSALP